MSTYQLLVGGVLPYIAVMVFTAGMGHRIYVWWKTPQPGKMTLFPAEPGSSVSGVLTEAFLFPGLFRADKALWSFSWLFHGTLALVLLGHIRVFTGFVDQMLLNMGMSPQGVDAMSSAAGGAAGVILLATGTLLLARRLAMPRVREISGAGDFIALLLLIAIIATGDAMRFGAHFDLEQTRIWAASLLRFSPVVPQNQTFLLHALLAQLLFVYIPFSKVMHFGGIFFTQALVKRR